MAKKENQNEEKTDIEVDRTTSIISGADNYTDIKIIDAIKSAEIVCALSLVFCAIINLALIYFNLYSIIPATLCVILFVVVMFVINMINIWVAHRKITRIIGSRYINKIIDSTIGTLMQDVLPDSEIKITIKHIDDCEEQCNCECSHTNSEKVKEEKPKRKRATKKESEVEEEKPKRGRKPKKKEVDE